MRSLPTRMWLEHCVAENKSHFTCPKPVLARNSVSAPSSLKQQSGEKSGTLQTASIRRGRGETLCRRAAQQRSARIAAGRPSDIGHSCSPPINLPGRSDRSTGLPFRTVINRR